MNRRQAAMGGFRSSWSCRSASITPGLLPELVVGEVEVPHELFDEVDLPGLMARP